MNACLPRWTLNLLHDGAQTRPSPCVLVSVIRARIVHLARSMLVSVHLFLSRCVIVFVHVLVRMRVTVARAIRVRVLMLVRVLVSVRVHENLRIHCRSKMPGRVAGRRVPYVAPSCRGGCARRDGADSSGMNGLLDAPGAQRHAPTADARMVNSPGTSGIVVRAAHAPATNAPSWKGAPGSRPRRGKSIRARTSMTGSA